MDKTRLKLLLSHLSTLEEKSPEREQYGTPPEIASEVLNRVNLELGLEGKEVADLGCGNGIFAIGAALLGAEASGFDVDGGAVERATRNRDALEREVGDIPASFERRDVRDVSGPFDIAVMNPPFGIQNEGENLVFVRKSLEIAPLVYSLMHRSPERDEETFSYIENFAGEAGASTVVLDTFDFPLPREFAFHARDRKHIKVDLYRFEREQYGTKGRK